MKILAPSRQDTIVFVLVQILVEEVIPEQEVCYMQAKVRQTSSSQIIVQQQQWITLLLHTQPSV